MTAPLRGGDPAINRARGLAQRAAFLDLCEQAITSGVPLPAYDTIAQVCGVTRITLATRISQLCTAGAIRRVAYPRGSAPVFQLRDGRTTPRGPRLERSLP